MTEAQPEQVVAVSSTGRRIPLDLVWAGRGADGEDTWQVI